MSIPGAEPWELAGFPGRLNIAAYLTADQVAAQYRVLARPSVVDWRARYVRQVTKRLATGENGWRYLLLA